MDENIDARDIMEGYKPLPEFEEDGRKLLTDLSLSDSTELWLIKWPDIFPPNLHGQELSLQLHQDGQLGSFLDSSGKSYEIMSCAPQKREASVFLSSSSDSKLVGKISRRVSLVHYPEPSELKEVMLNSSIAKYQKSLGISVATPSRQTSTFISPHSSSKRTSSTHTSKQKSTLSEYKDSPQPSRGRHEPERSESKDHSVKDSSKRKRKHEPSRSIDLSAQNSGHGHSHSSLTFSGSSGKSIEGKSKKQKK